MNKELKGSNLCVFVKSKVNNTCGVPRVCVELSIGGRRPSLASSAKDGQVTGCFRRGPGSHTGSWGESDEGVYMKRA